MSKPIPWVKFEKVSESQGRFIASPLENGMGVTIGNSLRRVLLSSLPGSAVTSIKVDGCQHEFSSIPNVVEDMFDVICNIKSVVFKCDDDDTKILKLEAKGAGKLSAKDIHVDGSVTIVNPDQHILEVADKGRVSIEMTLESGRGYVSAEANKDDEAALDTVAIDSSFSPITRVNHQVENIRVGKELDYDSLTLDVWTNRSISAEMAVQDAASILLHKFELFKSLNQEPEVQEVPDEQEAESDQSDTALNLSIDDLELSARSSNCLKRAGIETVGELIEKEIEELNQIKNFGKKSADEINDKLKQYSLSLKGMESEG